MINRSFNNRCPFCHQHIFRAIKTIYQCSRCSHFDYKINYIHLLYISKLECIDICIDKYSYIINFLDNSITFRDLDFKNSIISSHIPDFNNLQDALCICNTYKLFS